jgi:hypothetical protein
VSSCELVDEHLGSMKRVNFVNSLLAISFEESSLSLNSLV